MKLSNNFTLKEFTKSNTAQRRGIDNTPNEEHLDNLQKLVDNILQPLRDAAKLPIRITSGYRSKELNKAIGGSSFSDHSKGRAADLELYINGKEENAKLFNLIVSLNLPYYQIIWEYGDDNNPDWVHVAYREDNIRRQKLKAYRDENGNTKYLEL